MGFARRRPLLGTFITITCDLDETPTLSEAMTTAFHEAERLQSLYSVIDPESVLNRYNASAGSGEDWPEKLTHLIARALELQRASENFFNPYRSPQILDLSGIAKGTVVDQMVSVLRSLVPDFTGVVNAGGDLRFVGPKRGQRVVTARVGPFDHPVFREMILCEPHAAFASSSPSVAEGDEKSSSRYPLPLSEGLTKTHTACVAAREAWIADALTKVALHAPASVADRIAREYEATMVLFDERGEVVATYGQKEELK